MDLPGYDRWKTSPPEDKEIGHCVHCGKEIYEGEEYIRTGSDDMVLPDCWTEYSKNALKPKNDTMDLPRCTYCNVVIEEDAEYEQLPSGDKVHEDCWDDYSFEELNAERIEP